MRQKIKYSITGKRAAAVLVLLAAFFAGNLAARLQGQWAETAGRERLSAAQQGEVSGERLSAAQQGEVSGERLSAVQEEVQAEIEAQPELEESILHAADGSWGLSFQEEGKAPVANASIEELAKYDAYYAKDTEEKVLYLTFDCGYENGNTPPILEALKKHQAPATFFVVGTFVRDHPELIRQMVAEGHTVGNHTMHHPDMSKISDTESFRKELDEVNALYREITGQEMPGYYRPPQGRYSENNLKMARELGYRTFFWSLAYVDWYQDRQPTKDEAFQKLLGRVHPGAIVLLHNTSSTNGAILDELLTKWEKLGYRFESLEQLTAEKTQ